MVKIGGICKKCNKYYRGEVCPACYADIAKKINEGENNGNKFASVNVLYDPDPCCDVEKALKEMVQEHYATDYLEKQANWKKTKDGYANMNRFTKLKDFAS